MIYEYNGNVKTEEGSVFLCTYPACMSRVCRFIIRFYHSTRVRRRRKKERKKNEKEKYVKLEFSVVYVKDTFA